MYRISHLLIQCYELLPLVLFNNIFFQVDTKIPILQFRKPELAMPKLIRNFITVSFFLCLGLVNADAQVISGQINDQQNNPIPYATIYVAEAKEGTTSNIDGKFKLNLNRGDYKLTIRSMGYHELKKDVSLQTDSLFLPLTLKTQAFEIKEVKVFPGKEDPAYFIMRKAIAKAPYYRQKIKHYTADLYIKANFEFTNIPAFIKKEEIEDGKKFKDYFKENVTYVIESHNKISYNYPNKYNQKVISKKTSLVGFDEPPVMGLITSSIYEERPFQAISPLSSIALKHYNFKYEGYITVGDFDVFKIKVDPKRKSDELLEGYIYIVDKLWCVYNLDFNSSFEFFNMRVKQQFQNLGNENWLPVTYNIYGKGGALGLRGISYYGASVKYDSIVDNYQAGVQNKMVADNVIDDSKATKVTSKKQEELSYKIKTINSKNKLSNADVKKVSRLNRKMLKEQYKDSTIVEPGYDSYKIDDVKDSLISTAEWDTLRTIPLTPAEIRSYEISDSITALQVSDKDSLSANDQKSKNKQMLSKVAFGSYSLYKDSVFRFGYDGIISVNNFDFNAVDGYKYKQTFRFRFNPEKDKFIYLNPEVGYAFNRKALFGKVNARFNGIVHKGNRFELNAGKASFDFKNEELGISPALNAISSWFFAKNYMKLYESAFVHFNTSQKVKKDFTVLAAVKYDHFYPLKNNITYPLSDTREFSPNIPKGLDENSSALQEQQSFSYELGLNYRKTIRKPWLEPSPFLFFDDFYSATLSFKQGLPNVFNSVSHYKQIAFSWHQQINIAPTAGIDWRLNTGYFFNSNQMHFSQYQHFRTAEIPVSLSAFTNSFQLINDYEFSTNKSYLNVGIDFRSEYILLRYISFLNKKTWSESLHFNYLTTPALNNYWELGYSLNSLFFAGNIGVFTGFKEGKFESVAVKLSISVFD